MSEEERFTGGPYLCHNMLHTMQGRQAGTYFLYGPACKPKQEN